MKIDINSSGECLNKQAYMETVCYKCGFWGHCQAEIIADCIRVDKEDEEKKARNYRNFGEEL